LALKFSATVKKNFSKNLMGVANCLDSHTLYQWHCDSDRV